MINKNDIIKTIKSVDYKKIFSLIKQNWFKILVVLFMIFAVVQLNKIDQVGRYCRLADKSCDFAQADCSDAQDDCENTVSYCDEAQSNCSDAQAHCDDAQSYCSSCEY